ncbi:MAG: hypothetical protein OEM28_13430 [Nitrosopumilus sp.]|nr:hypothetical protein [Nitrosopumilus sp.]MDH3488808.1 hypothetical protein [Nitrosopumilus sp.]
MPKLGSGQGSSTCSNIILDDSYYAIFIACFNASSPARVPPCGTRIVLYIIYNLHI